jgi:proline-specific peptidase
MSNDDGDDGEWSGWTCDELTPDLCPLDVTVGYFTARGGIKIRYWRYQRKDRSILVNNENDDGRRRKLPILALHGGPGWPHGYMLPLKQQACRGREIIFYDQAGCGESVLSSASIDDYPWLLEMSYYSEAELPALLSHLGLTEYHLLGSSWGTTLALLFALNTSPEGLVSMVLSGPFADAKLYMDTQWDDEDGTLGSLPPFVQNRIRDLESKRAYNSSEYEAIDGILTSFFTCRTAPQPDCLVESAKGLNREIYIGMQGPSEFSISGALGGEFNLIPRLRELGDDLPVLLTHGKFDTMRPALVDAIYKAIPVSEKVLFRRSGHVSMIDEPGPMNDAVADFFDRVEEARFTKTPFVPKGDEKTMTKKAGEKPNDNNGAVTAVCDNSAPFSYFVVSVVTVLAFVIGALIGRQSRRRHGFESV